MKRKLPFKHPFYLKDLVPRLRMILVFGILVALGPVSLGQTTLQTVDFETNGSGYTVTPQEYVYVSESSSRVDYWTRTNGGAEIATANAFSSYQGSYFFAGEDFDNMSGTEFTVVLNSVSVSSYTDLQIKILLGGRNSDIGKEGEEFIKIQYQYDDGGYTTLAQFLGNPNGNYYEEDADANDTVDVGGAQLTEVMQEFTYSIPSSGSNLQMRIYAYGGVAEEIAFDNIRVLGMAATPPTVTTAAASSVTDASASLGGNVTAAGSSSVSVRGVVYSSTDNTPTIGEAGVTNNTNGSGTGLFSETIGSLSASTTYYFQAYATSDAGTSYGGVESFTTYASATSFTGAGNWSTPGNWSAGIPGPTTDVTITGTCTADGSSTVDDLTVNSGASLAVASGQTLTVSGNLTLKSDATGTASLINSGTLSVTGTTNAERYMTGSKWHLVSPTTAGGSISTFIQDAVNAIPIQDATNYRMMDYNETPNQWNSYYTAATEDTFVSGKGYCLRRTADGVVTFTGALTSGAKSVALTKGGEGWNCVGNPYPSAINMNTEANGSNNFLKTNAINASRLDESYACIYVWEQDAAGYKILGNASFGTRDLAQNVFQAGQGFFVKAKDNTGLSVQFTTDMQVHQTGMALKSANVSWPGFELAATNGQTKASTVVAFNSAMTKGLDPTYDAGLLRGSSGLSLYSRLVEDNGVDFAIQCLPEAYESLVIPIGVECKAGGEITFSAETMELPLDCGVILEDKSTGIYTSLANGASYNTSVAAETKGTGRFFIHTSYLTTTGNQTLPGETGLKIYRSAGEIVIDGKVGAQTTAGLMDINGRKIGVFNLHEGTRNSIPASGLTPGVYLLQIKETGKSTSAKVIVQ